MSRGVRVGERGGLSMCVLLYYIYYIYIYSYIPLPAYQPGDGS